MMPPLRLGLRHPPLLRQSLRRLTPLLLQLQKRLDSLLLTAPHHLLNPLQLLKLLNPLLLLLSNLHHHPLHLHQASHVRFRMETRNAEAATSRLLMETMGSRYHRVASA